MIGNDGFVTYVPPSLADAFEKRGFQVFDDDVKVAGVDRGGAVFEKAKQVEVMVSGTIIRIPVRDIVYYDEALIAAQMGQDGGYRLEGWHTAIVLTSLQRVELLASWAKGIDGWRRAAAIELRAFTTAVQGVEFQQMVPDGTVH